MNKSIYSRQFSILAFVIMVVGKLQLLPGLIGKDVTSSSNFIVQILMILDLCVFAIVCYIVSIDGMTRLAKFRNNVLFKAVLVFLEIYFFIKILLAFLSCVTFIQQQMFDSSFITVICITCIGCMMYFAFKGINTIARSCEIFMIVITLFLTMIFCFFKTDIYLYRNLPVFTQSFGKIIQSMSKYFLWFGDSLILLFTKVSKQKFKVRHFVISGVSAFIFIALNFILMNGIYGKGLEYVNNFLVSLASFNRFSLSIGRLDWLGIVSYLLMALIYLCIYLWGIGEVLKYIFPKYTEKKLFITGFAIVIACTGIFLKNYDDAIQWAMGGVSFFACFVNYIVPVIILLLLIGLPWRHVEVYHRKGALYSEKY